MNIVELLKKQVGNDVYRDSFTNFNKVIYIKTKDKVIDFSKKKYQVRSIYCTNNSVTERGIYTTTQLKRENDHARVLNYVY